MVIKLKDNLGKKEIINNVKSVVGFSSNNLQKITDDIIDIIIDKLISKKKINIKNLGSFKINFKKEREGRNPKTKEKFVITSRNTITFKASTSLKEKVNEI